MGNGTARASDLHSAAYFLDLEVAQGMLEDYRASRKASESRNPVNLYGLMDGRAIYFQKSAGTVPIKELPDILTVFRFSPDAAQKFLDLVDPQGKGVIRFESFVELYMQHLRPRGIPPDSPLSKQEKQRIRNVFHKHSMQAYVLRRHPAGVRQEWSRDKLKKKGRESGLYGTPLHFACMGKATSEGRREKQRKLVRLLLQHGATMVPAKADHPDSPLVSVFALAQTNGNSHLLPLLTGEAHLRKLRSTAMQTHLQDVECLLPAAPVQDEEAIFFSPNSYSHCGVLPEFNKFMGKKNKKKGKAADNLSDDDSDEDNQQKSEFNLDDSTSEEGDTTDHPHHHRAPEAGAGGSPGVSPGVRSGRHHDESTYSESSSSGSGMSSHRSSSVLESQRSAMGMSSVFRSTAVMSVTSESENNYDTTHLS